MEEIERLLLEGHPVVCANCPHVINHGETYVMRGEYMYCDEECADEGEREQLLKRARDYHFVPGHGPNLDEMDNEKLRKFVDMMDSAFSLAFSEKNREEEDL